MLIDFRTIELTPRPNQFLIAPDGVCEAATPHETAREFELPADALQDRLFGLITSTPRVRETDRRPDGHQAHFVATTALLRFKDDVNVEVFDLGGERSSFAIYSRSRIGHSDLGANRKRVMAWVDAL